MKVDISYNDELKGIELRFSEKPSAEVIQEVKKKMGFRYSKRQNMWYAARNAQRETFAKDLQQALQSGEDPQHISIAVQPSNEPSEENIKHRKFSYVTIYYKDSAGKGATDQFVLFEPSRNLALDIATQFAQNRYGDSFEKVYVYPKNYVREARKLLVAGKVITGTGNEPTTQKKVEQSGSDSPKPNDFNAKSEKEKTWVVYDSNGAIDSLQISEKKAIDYINRRPEFSRDKMSYKRMSSKKAHTLWKKQQEKISQETDDLPNEPVSEYTPMADDGDIWVVYDSNGAVDSFQISEKKAVEYINRRPEFARDKMSYERMRTKKALTLKKLKPEIPITKVTVKQIELTTESESRIPDYSKAKTLTTWQEANKYIKSLVGQVSDVYYKITWQDGETMDGVIDMEPSTDFKGKLNILSDWVKTFLTNVSQATPDGIVNQEQIDRAKKLIKGYALDDTVKAALLTSKEKLEVLSAFGKFHQKRKEEFPEMVIEEHELPIQFGSWLKVNHPELTDQKDSIWKEYHKIQEVVHPDTEKRQIPKRDYRLFFVRFIEHATPKVGENPPLEVFVKWLEDNYPTITEADKLGLTEYYSDHLDKLGKQQKRIEGLSKPKKAQPYHANFNKFQKVVPNLQTHLEKGYTYGKSTFGEDPGLMDLNLDVLYKDDKGRYVIALSHLYKQNGDAIADPDMQMRIDFKQETVEALTFQDAFGFQQVYKEEDGKTMVNSRQKKEQNKFLSLWLSNLVDQGHKIVWEQPEDEEATSQEEPTPVTKIIPIATPKKLNQHELNKMIEQFIAEKDENGADYTEEDKQYIAQYSGAGGLAKKGASGKGLLYEYFTDDAIVEKMWGLAFKYGYNGGAVLEPSCGTGNFFNYLPAEALATGYEINPTSKRIAELLYPHVTIHQASFESIFFKGNIHLKDDFGKVRYDLIIGNPPYGEFSGRYAGMGEKGWTKATRYEDYFMTRGLDLLNPGGLLIYIIPSSFLKSGTSKVKEKIAEKIEPLTDGYRNPSGVFATTDIGTDIIVMKKKK